MINCCEEEKFWDFIELSQIPRNDLIFKHISYVFLLIRFCFRNHVYITNWYNQNAITILIDNQKSSREWNLISCFDSIDIQDRLGLKFTSWCPCFFHNVKNFFSNLLTIDVFLLNKKFEIVKRFDRFIPYRKQKCWYCSSKLFFVLFQDLVHLSNNVKKLFENGNGNGNVIIQTVVK